VSHASVSVWTHRAAGFADKVNAELGRPSLSRASIPPFVRRPSIGGGA